MLSRVHCRDAAEYKPVQRTLHTSLASHFSQETAPSAAAPDIIAVFDAVPSLHLILIHLAVYYVKHTVHITDINKNRTSITHRGHYLPTTQLRITSVSGVYFNVQLRDAAVTDRQRAA